MARVLVNFIYNKAKDEYKVLDQGCVYADQKVAVLETEELINEPLVVPINGAMTVVDRKRYETLHKKFHLVADKDGNISENENGAEIWLPKDTDISKLRFINNQLVKVEDEPQQEEPKLKKPKEKKEG